MNYSFEYELDYKGIDNFFNKIDEIEKIYKSKGLLKYVADKCQKELKNISLKNLTTISSKEDIDKSLYMNSNKIEINYEDMEITLYNDSEKNISEKNISAEKLANYPLKLSLAQIVEFGIGYTGSINARSEVDSSWQYDVNNHGYKGWYYKDENGVIHWTNGYAGRYIYLKLKQYVEKNAETWIKEYIEKKIKD